MPSSAAAVAPSRREKLLEAAAGLFAARGYHAVGIDDIGAAAGISGPGVYRHFASKQALLEALCDAAMNRMLAGARAITAAADEPAAAVDALVGLHVDFAVGDRALLGVWAREQRSLSEDLHRRQREYEQVWRTAVRPLREDLAEDEVAVVVLAALALLNTTALYDVRVPPERLRALLRRTVLGALLAR